MRKMLGAQFSSIPLGLTIALLFLALPANLSFGAKDPPQPPAATGCQDNVTTSYDGNFDAGDFDLINVDVDDDGYLFLDTNNQALKPDNVKIEIPFEQDVYVSFFYEDAGHESTLGWMLKEDAVDSNGNFLRWNNIPTAAKHPIFRRIADGIDGGDGILDEIPGSTEAAAAGYDDGTGYKFIVDGDGALTPKDMRKHIGIFEGGSEIVFFLGANQDYDSSKSDQFFFTKQEWNPDTYNTCGPLKRTYKLGAFSEGNCLTAEKGLLDENAIKRLKDQFTLSLSGTRVIDVVKNKKFPHVLVAAPDEDLNQWILSWEDLSGGGDMDYNDTTFRIERKTGGMAQLRDTKTITPSDPQAYYTAVNFRISDWIPGDSCSGKTKVRYWISIGKTDGKYDWVEVAHWDQVREFEVKSGGERVLGAPVSGWLPGTPELTYRTARIDFAGLGYSGRELVWKVEMQSEEESCVPRVLAAELEAEAASNTFFSRGSPVMLANVLYSGSYETPYMRGHIKATQLYEPRNTAAVRQEEIWDGGEKLLPVSGVNRDIYIPDLTVSTVPEEFLTLTTPDGERLTEGDGTTTILRGKLAHAPVVATSLSIRADTRIFRDVRTDTLKSAWGTGTIDRFTGEFEIIFDDPPSKGIPFKASYSWYQTSADLKPFTPQNITKEMLALDDTYTVPTGYRYDFDQDGQFDEDDADALVNWIHGYSNEWKLGPIDHSVPAVLTPPGVPTWYYGTDIPASEKASYEEFRADNQTRRSVLFIGARDGMLHAFDAGNFSWADNPNTKDKENRGHFVWDGKDPDYGTGNELWAFIPSNLLPRLKNNRLMTEDQAYVDASPALADVFIGGQWKSVLLAAEGNGGDTVFCLDVTDPNNPKYLWEFSDPDLFRSRSSPAVGQIGRILVDGQSKWAAFFVSGKSHESDLYPSIYVIDVADGSVEERIFLDVEPQGIGGVPSGQPAVLDSDGNGYIDRLYVGTDKGRMYKVNLSDDPKNFISQINQCVVNIDFTDDDISDPLLATVPEDQQWHPIFASPAVVPDHGIKSDGSLDKKVRIFFGTGDSPFFDEDIDTHNTQYHFFAYLDRSEKMECSESKVELDWFKTLPAGARVFASAFAAAGKIYFGTSTAETENPCEPSNDGKLYVVDMDDPGSETVLDTGNITSTPLVQDKHLFVRTKDGLKMMGDGKFNNALKQGGEAEAKVKAWREVRSAD